MNQLGLGLAKASKFFDEERAAIVKLRERAVRELAAKHADRGRNAFVDGLEAYGMDEFEEDFVDRYRSMVMAARWYDHEGFIAWVEERVLAGEKLTAPSGGRPRDLSGIADDLDVDVDFEA